LHLSKNSHLAKCQWLTPVILATQETEIRKITVLSQPGQIVLRPYLKKKPIAKKKQKKGLVEWLKV
jgi:hypothetical protein